MEWRVAARHGATRHRGAVARLPIASVASVSRAPTRACLQLHLVVWLQVVLTMAILTMAILTMAILTMAILYGHTHYGEARQQQVGGLPLLLAQRSEQRRLACNTRCCRLQH